MNKNIILILIALLSINIGEAEQTIDEHIISLEQTVQRIKGDNDVLLRENRELKK